MRALARRGHKLHRGPYLSNGVDPHETLRTIWPDWQPGRIFDVGANVGQIDAALHTRNPRAQIHSFESVPATFTQLRQNLAAQPSTPTASPFPTAKAHFPWRLSPTRRATPSTFSP